MRSDTGFRPCAGVRPEQRMSRRVESRTYVWRGAQGNEGAKGRGKGLSIDSREEIIKRSTSVAA